MNKSFVSIEIIKDELNQIDHLASELSQKLSLLSQDIKYILSQIKSCKTIKLAEKYFDLLDMIQFTLSTLVFKHELNLSERLRKFVRDFDNIEADKKYYFKKIKNEEYHF